MLLLTRSTGAGKSSLLQALFRYDSRYSPVNSKLTNITVSIVNLEEGSIVIDGYDIKDIVLDVLRGGLALVPQDSTLFLGTLRENL